MKPYVQLETALQLEHREQAITVRQFKEHVNKSLEPCTLEGVHVRGHILGEDGNWIVKELHIICADCGCATLVVLWLRAKFDVSKVLPVQMRQDKIYPLYVIRG